MKRAFVFKGKEYDKYWWYNHTDTELMVYSGKEGNLGKFQLSKFKSIEACEQEIEKRVTAKLKKGFLETNDFDFSELTYLDDVEYGLHRLTSHPNFVRYFQDDIYYDSYVEEAPFGNNAGADTLVQLEEDLRKFKEIKWLKYPKRIIETYWDMEFIPSTNQLNEEKLRKQLEEDDEISEIIYQSDQVIIAVAFGKIKIRGSINEDLKQLALQSLKRIEMLAKIKGWGENSEIGRTLINDLSLFPVE